MTSETWSIVASVATAVGTAVAALGLIGAWLGIRQNTRAMGLQVLESIFKDIRQLDREYIGEFARWNPAQRNAWSATFFNTVEYLCFVVNRKITRDEALKKFFFDEALPAWRKTFDEHVRDGIIKDAPEMFPEFKRAYRSITSC
jgi:hypothetical protein